jgi:hypothetical protein
MSSIFWDNLILLPAVEAEIKTVAETEEEKHELWQIVDEIIHHRMLELILDVLNEEHHHEFLERFHQAPHDEMHFVYLEERVEGNIKELFIEKIKEFEAEILRDIRA